MRTLSFLMLLVWSASLLADPPAVRFERRDHDVGIWVGRCEVARYVFLDPQIPRPFIADVRTLSGWQVSRNHPPIEGQDATDHALMHPGIWLAFGDLSGEDYWRLKSPVVHVEFMDAADDDASQPGFAVLNRYLSMDRQHVICEERCRYSLQLIPHGYLISIHSEFMPGANRLVFGDQEEMGFAIRMASSLAVDRGQGGRLLDSAGRKNGAEVWGKTADWCDYSGPMHGRWVGMTVMSSPSNFRPSWSHARDYGFVAVNPFGRNAFTKGAESAIEVKPGETLAIRFAVAVHESESESDYRPDLAFSAFAATTK